MARIEIPVIGIGAGPATDGQVLVFHDLLGIRDGLGPRFVKRYANLQQEMNAGVAPTPRTCARAATPAPSTPTRSTPPSCGAARAAGLRGAARRAATCRPESRRGQAERVEVQGRPRAERMPGAQEPGD